MWGRAFFPPALYSRVSAAIMITVDYTGGMGMDAAVRWEASPRIAAYRKQLLGAGF